MPRRMQVKPRKAETTKTRNPNQLEKINTIIARKRSIAMLSLLYFIFVIFLARILARKIVKKKAIIPDKSTAARIIKRSF